MKILAVVVITAIVVGIIGFLFLVYKIGTMGKKGIAFRSLSGEKYHLRLVPEIDD